MPTIASRSSVAPEQAPPIDNPMTSSLLSLRLLDQAKAVNILLLDFNPEAMFAGVKTALEAASILGELTGRSVRLLILSTSNPSGDDPTTFVERRLSALRSRFGAVNWAVVRPEDLARVSFSVDDIWLATHWITAHALDRAAHDGIIDPRRVIYLVQDYEPEYFAGESDRPAAESTYRAGFTLLINSRQVADFLRERNVTVDYTQVFAPTFDMRQLRVVAARRSVPRVPRVFFYGRPSKPRNMYALGIDTLRQTAEDLARRNVSVDFVMAGENGPDLDLGHGYTLRNLGVLDRASYFDEIARVDVALALQATPHPSHLPFDFAISGAFAVTNDIDRARNAMHPRICAAPPTPTELSALLITMLHRARDPERVRTGLLPVLDGQLGSSLHDAAKSALADVST